MSTRSFLALAVVLLTTTLFSIGAVANSDSKAMLQSLPLAFEQNVGQASSEYHFLARRNGAETYFSDDSIRVSIPTGRPGERRSVKLKFLKVSDSVRIAGEEEGVGHINYLLGRDAQKWLRNVPQFTKLRYSGLYSGVDLLFYGAGSELEHDFVLSPGVRPDRIAFTIENGDRISIRDNGDLDIGLDTAVLSFKKPIAYQTVAGERRLVPVAFKKRGRMIGFSVGDYDRNLPLVIDPVLAFSTYLDGTGGETINAVTTDAAGNIYVTGSTGSVDFPVTNGVVQPNPCATMPCSGSITVAFVTKLDSTGHTLLFSTFLGGTQDKSSVYGYSIAVDSNGNVIVSGNSSGQDFPQAGNLVSTTSGYSATPHFLASLKSDGSAFNFAGPLGGSAFYFTPGKLAVDSQGNVYFTGQTEDSGFPTTPGVLSTTIPGYPYTSTFVLKVDKTGKLLYSTAIPGSAPDNPAPENNSFVPRGIAVDSNGNVSIAGDAGAGLPTTPGTLSPDYPRQNGYAGFVLKLNSTASAVLSGTYVPEVGAINAFTTDTSGNYYLTGYTQSTTLPVSINAYQKTLIPGTSPGYVLKLDSSCATVLAGTYLSGTTGGTKFTSIALDSRSNVMLAGFSTSNDFPLVHPMQTDISSATFSSAIGEILAELNPDLSSLLFSTFLHGNGWPSNGTQFNGVAIAPGDFPVVIGNTTTQDFPTTSTAFQKSPPTPGNSSSGLSYSVIAKIDLATPSPAVCMDRKSVDFGTVLVNSSKTQTVNISNCGNAPLTINSAASSSPLVQVSHNCSAVAPGSSCSVSLIFTPVDRSGINGTVTLTDNAGVETQQIAFSGKGGVPRFFALSSDVGDALVGSPGIPRRVYIENMGDAPLSISNVSATSEFAVDNQCTAAVQPNESCYVLVTFTPTQAGGRTGTVTVVDNAAGSPHTIAVTGNGITSYPIPSIIMVHAVPSGYGGTMIYGTKFFPTSTVLWNGQPRPTRVVGPEVLNVLLTAEDVSVPGEVPVSVVNPSPGGGASDPYMASVYGRIDDIVFNHVVLERNSGLLYATVSPQSTRYPDSVIAIDPESMAVVKTFSIGGTPNQLAVSDDGTLLYVGLDGTGKIAQMALPSGAVNFTVDLGVDSNSGQPVGAYSLIVLPGKAHTWVASLGGTGVPASSVGIAVFDDDVARANQSTEAPNYMTFVGSDTQKLFATWTPAGANPSPFYRFDISDSGISLTSKITDIPGTNSGGGHLVSDGTNIYLGNGQIIDPVSLTVKDTFQLPFIYYCDKAIALDPGNSRIYFSGYDYEFEVMAFDRTSKQTLGTIMSLFESNWVYEVIRYGRNGLAVQTHNALLFFRTSLTGSSPSIKVTPPTLDFGTQMVTSSSSKTVTITNPGTDTLNIANAAETDTGSNFRITNNCPSTLAAGANCTISVTFAPQSSGTKSGTLTVSHNAVSYPVTISLTGTAADFALSTSADSTATVSAGQTANYSLQLAGTTGLTATANLSCTGAPTGASCTVSPNPVTVSGTTPVTVSVRVTTNARSTAAALHSGPTSTGGVPFWAMFAMSGIGAIVVVSSGHKKVRLTTAGCLLLMLSTLISCGGGSGGSTSPPPPPPAPGTPAGTYTLTVNATVNGVTRSSSLTLTVR